MKNLIILVLIFSASPVFANSDCCGGFETPDFSNFPVHVCEYLTENYQEAKKIEHLYGVPAAVTLGVAGFESGWGQSGYAKNKNNHFGVKLRSGKFKTYGSKTASFYDFAELMISKRYKGILERDKPQSYWKWCLWLHKRGYCRSKGYDERLYKVVRWIDRHNKF